MTRPRSITIDLRLIVLVLGFCALIYCVIFPPRRWTVPADGPGTPARGRVWHSETKDKDWVSYHMYIDRGVAKDYHRLAFECASVAAATAAFWLVARFVDKRNG